MTSVQFSRSVVSDSLRPHEPQHARPPCPSPTPGVHSDSRPSNQWCHPAISSSVFPFFSCPQFLPASKSFPMSQLFARGGQSAGRQTLYRLSHQGSPWYFVAMHILLWKVYLSWDLSIMVPHCSVTWQRLYHPETMETVLHGLAQKPLKGRTCYPVAGECSHSTASSYQSIQGLFGLPCPRSHLFLGGLKAWSSCPTLAQLLHSLWCSW